MGGKYLVFVIHSGNQCDERDREHSTVPYTYEEEADKREPRGCSQREGHRESHADKEYSPGGSNLVGSSGQSSA